ncbi:MAG TPA: CrcB family protein, partial [Roseiflexaceae bacterium]|nr:CrcB family protein [Roseiflexaceae bacterium]
MLAIAVGAAVGANLRYLISSWASIRLGADFPYGTLIVNLIGSLAVGIFAGLVLRMPVLEPWR